ncbi:MAG: transposase [Deltaproteobacteria bacterium]|nr:transposase [Deltaproteobacteria bacterium]
MTIHVRHKMVCARRPHHGVRLTMPIESPLSGASHVVGCDATTVKILAPKRCDRRSVYVFHADGHVAFRVLDRGDAESVFAAIPGFRGVMMSDAGSVFTSKHREQLQIRMALCNAHARRYFSDARETDKATADHALRLYRNVALYERSFASLAPSARAKERGRIIAPMMEAFYKWLSENLSKTRQGTPIPVASSYPFTFHEGMTVFVRDGRVAWTHNESERHLRHIVVGRKAWMFRGNMKSAKDACVLWSLAMSCRVNNVDPEKYLGDVLRALPDVSASGLHAWTPRAYALRHARAD